MYDVMIIDDDQFIRDRLKKIIDWERIGINLVCEAQDSDSARELFLLHRPKIIITDINIPIISGLDLANEIVLIDPDVRFIVITGFTDFEYVKSSVKLGVIDLISKPLLPEDINESLQKTVAYFNKLRIEQSSLTNMRMLLEESLPIYREKFIGYLLTQKRDYSENDILHKFNSMGMKIKGQYYTVALISPVIDTLSVSETDVTLVAIKNVSDEIMSAANYRIYSFYDTNYRLNCLLAWDFENNSELLEETIQKIYKKIHFYWEIEIYVGIGAPITDITNLHMAFKEAFISLNYQGILSNEPVVNYRNIERLEMPIIIDKSKIINDAIKCFKNADLESMNRIIKNELASMLTVNNGDIQSIRKFIFEMISAIIAESISLNIKAEIILKYYETYEKLLSTDNIQLLSKYTTEFAERILLELLKNRSVSKNMLIKMSKDFILQNLGNEDLSLEIVSKHIGLSSIYFCKLFHKEEGTSFNDYLNIQRINKAKELLLETNLKVFEVGYATGYGNPKYFNYVFKRIAGITPLEYRNAER